MRRMGLLMMCCIGCAGWAQVVPLTPAAQAEWRNHLLPLPHEITVSHAFQGNPRDIGIFPARGAGAIEQQALGELRAVFKARTGMDPTGTRFRIVIGVFDQAGAVESLRAGGAAALKTRPNPDQAYLIEPAGTNRLLVGGWNAAGVYFGVQTLIQLLEPRLTPGQALIPLARVADWPDFDERGLWNNSLSQIPWLATLKLNYSLAPAGIGFAPGQPVQCLRMQTNAYPAASVRPFHLENRCPHLDFFARYGMQDVYPELVGQGERAKSPYHHRNQGICPCASNPLFRKILLEWAEDAVRQGAREIGIWLSELTPIQCECAACRQSGIPQIVMETKVACEVFRELRQKHPAVSGRILFTQGWTGYSNDLAESYACLKLLPPEIKAEKVYGFNPAFDEYAASGRWVATFNGSRLSPQAALRFWGAQDIPAVMQRLYTNHWSGVYSWAPVKPPADVKGGYDHVKGLWERELYNFHISALAEWSWNVNGRDAAALGTAWATRRGLEAPDEIGRWIALMGPIECSLENIHAFVPSGSAWKTAIGQLEKGERLALGAGLFRPFAATTDFAERENSCRQALALVASHKDPTFAVETKLVLTLMDAIQRLNEIFEAAASAAMPAAARRARLDMAAGQFAAAVENLAAVSGQMDDLLMRSVEPGPQPPGAGGNAWREMLARVQKAVAQCAGKP